MRVLAETIEPGHSAAVLVWRTWGSPLREGRRRRRPAGRQRPHRTAFFPASRPTPGTVSPEVGRAGRGRRTNEAPTADTSFSVDVASEINRRGMTGGNDLATLPPRPRGTSSPTAARYRPHLATRVRDFVGADGHGARAGRLAARAQGRRCALAIKPMNASGRRSGSAAHGSGTAPWDRARVPAAGDCLLRRTRPASRERTRADQARSGTAGWTREHPCPAGRQVSVQRGRRRFHRPSDRHIGRRRQRRPRTVRLHRRTRACSNQALDRPRGGV